MSLKNNSILTIIQQAIQAISALYLVKLYSSNLSIDELGTNFLIINLSSAIAGLLIGPATQATFLNYSNFESKIDISIYFNYLLCNRNKKVFIVLVFSIILSLALCLINFKNRYLPFIIGLIIVFEMFKYTEEYILISQKKIKTLVYGNFLDFFLKLLFSLYFINSNNKFFLSILPYTFLGSILLILNRRKLYINKFPENEYSVKLSSDSTSIYPLHISNNLFDLIIKNYIYYIFGAFVSGIFYAFFNFLKRIFGVFHHVLSVNLLPIIAQKNISGNLMPFSFFNIKIYDKIKAFWLLSLFLLFSFQQIFFYFFSKNFILTFLDIKYINYANYLFFLLFYFLLDYCILIFNTFEIAKFNFKKVLARNIVYFIIIFFSITFLYLNFNLPVYSCLIFASLIQFFLILLSSFYNSNFY